MNSLIECRNYYLAGLLVYGGYTLSEARWDTDSRTTTFIFEMPQWSYDELLAAFESDEGQPVTSVRHYAEALKSLDAKQRLARQSEFGFWSIMTGEKSGVRQRKIFQRD